MTSSWRRTFTAVGLFISMNIGALSQQSGNMLVEGGTFRMGTAASEIPELKSKYGVSFPGVFEDEVPDHRVTVSSFRMDRYEVTNARFLEFVIEHAEWSRTGMPGRLHNGHYLEHWIDGKPPAGKDDHPVVYVTWHAAQSFCLEAGGRLPTEAEWEYAARAGGNLEFPWGEEPPETRRANYSASRTGDTRPVGSYPANAIGLHDMAGNVWEFILDSWGAYSAAPQTDPLIGGAVPRDLLAVQGRRVLRGASFGGGAVNLRTRWRDSHDVSNAVAFVGFRCAYPIRDAEPRIR